MEKICVLTLTDERLARLIKGYVDFDNIVHHAPNLLRDPIHIREKVGEALTEIGIPVRAQSGGRILRSVRLECSDDNGTYYMLCNISSDCDSGAFVVLVGHLYKVVEGLDPFSFETDMELTSEQVDVMNKEYIKKILNK